MLMFWPHILALRHSAVKERFWTVSTNEQSTLISSSHSCQEKIYQVKPDFVDVFDIVLMASSLSIQPIFLLSSFVQILAASHLSTVVKSGCRQTSVASLFSQLYKNC